MSKQNSLERFIPYQSSEIIDMLCAAGWPDKQNEQRFRNFCTILSSIYHFDFHSQVKALKAYYHPFDPDRDTKTNRVYSPEELLEYETKLIAHLTEALTAANYEMLSAEELKRALTEDLLLPVSLDVDFEDFAHYMVQRRGDVTHKVTVSKWLFWRREIDVPVFERVVMLIKFKGADYFATKKRRYLPFEPGSMVIKLFKNIPKADLEMLFPNVRLKMRMLDKLLIGVPAISGAVGIFIKTGAGLLAFVVILQALIKHMVYGGGFVMPQPGEFAQIVAGVTALSAIIGYVLQQWSKYKNRKIEFLKTLGDNLYFKNLDNNVGVFHHVIDAAEEEECKEAILAYYFLLQHPTGLSATALDSVVETWFADKYNVHLDFEIDDALRKLLALGLCKVINEDYCAISLEEACKHLDMLWDNYFQYNV